MKRVKAGFIAPVGKGVRQEIGGKHGGKSKGKGIMHKALGFHPSVVSRNFSEDTAIGVGELATRKRSVCWNKSTQRAIHHKTRCKDTS